MQLAAPPDLTRQQHPELCFAFPLCLAGPQPPALPPVGPAPTAAPAEPRRGVSVGRSPRTGLDWDGVNCLSACCVCAEDSVDHTEMGWSLLGSACAASRPFLLLTLPCQRAGWGAPGLGRGHSRDS